MLFFNLQMPKNIENLWLNINHSINKNIVFVKMYFEFDDVRRIHQPYTDNFTRSKYHAQVSVSGWLRRQDRNTETDGYGQIERNSNTGQNQAEMLRTKTGRVAKEETETSVDIGTEIHRSLDGQGTKGSETNLYIRFSLFR